MKEFGVYIAFDKRSQVFTISFIEAFSKTLEMLIKKRVKTEIRIKSSLSQGEKLPDGSIDILILLYTEHFHESIQQNSENGLIRKYANSNPSKTHKILFTEPTPTLINDNIEAHLYDLSSFGNEQLQKMFSVEEYDNHSEIWLTLIDLVSKIDLQSTNKSKKTSSTIFIAETTKDLVANRKALKRDLTYSGYNVLPETTFYFQIQQVRKSTNKHLIQSDLIIHMFGGKAGEKIDNQEIALFQNQLAAEYCLNNQNHNRLIWIPRDIVYENREQRLAIEKLKRDTEGLTGAEIIQTPIEAFKSIVINRLKAIQNKNKTNLDKEEQFAYLLYHKENEDHADRLNKILAKNQYKAIKNLHFGDKKKLLQHHRESLLHCDSVILLENNKYPEWTSSKKKDIIKAIGLGRERSFGKKIILKEKIPIEEQHPIDDSIQITFDEDNFENKLSNILTTVKQT